MKITFLGTGTSSGVPMIACNCDVCTSADPMDKRLRSSVMVDEEGTRLIIDIGPDFRQQMLTQKVQEIEAVLLTHSHKDHTGGLDDIRAFNFALKKDIPVYADRQTARIIKRQYEYIFEDNPYPGIPKIAVKLFDSKPFEIQSIPVQPIQVMHHKMPVWGFRMGGLTYITDANYISPEEKEKIRGSEVFVINALRKREHISHFTLQQAIDLAEELQVGHCYITHISHQLGKHAQVSAELPENVSLAYDGLSIEVHR